MKKISLIAALALSAVMLAGCTPKNTVHSVSDLEGKSIGVQLGTTGIIFAKDVQGADIQNYITGEEAVEALIKGDIDAVIIDKDPAEVFVQNHKELQILPDPFADEEYAIAVSLTNTELQSQINDTLSTLKSDGTIDNIMNSWLGGNTAKYVSPSDVVRDNGTLVMSTNAEFAPYESFEGDKIVGIDVDIMQAVCDNLGMDLEIYNTDFDRIIPDVATGQVDVGVAAITITEEREKSVLFSDPYASSVQVIITRKD